MAEQINFINCYGSTTIRNFSTLTLRGLTLRPFGYERVYLPLHKVADTPFHIQGDD